MRNRFNEPRRGRRPDRSGSAPINSSPYDFGSADDDQVDPVDLMAIRADDELLDALASGEVPFGGFGSGVENDLDGGFQDDGQVLAMLAAWREEVLEDSDRPLVSVEDASAAIVAGQRTVYPKRRLMPVAAAAAAVVLGMSGVAIGAGTAEPGDPLWGVSKSLNSDRAESKEAAQRVSVTLASVQQALDEGRVKDAQVALAAVAPELDKVKDDDVKQELAQKQANLTETVEDAEEGEKVHTDQSGKRDSKDKDGKDKSDKDKSSSSHSSSPKPSDPKSGQDPDGRDKSSSPASSTSAPDPRRSAVTTTKPATPPGSTTDKPAPDSTTKPGPTRPTHQEPKPKPDPTKSDPTKPDPTKPESKPTKPEPKPDSDKKGDGEGGPATTSTSTPTAAGPPPPAPVGGP